MTKILNHQNNQTKLTSWIDQIQVNKDIIDEMHNSTKSLTEMKIQMEYFDVMEDMIKKIEHIDKKEIQQTVKNIDFIKRKETTWKHKYEWIHHRWMGIQVKYGT